MATGDELEIARIGIPTDAKFHYNLIDIYLFCHMKQILNVNIIHIHTVVKLKAFVILGTS